MHYLLTAAPVALLLGQAAEEKAPPVLDLDGKVRPVVDLAQTAEVTVGADGFTAPSE